MTELNKRDMRERLGNVEQIREILLGGQLRGYEERFEKLEGGFESLQREVRDQLDQIQSTVSSELKSIADSIEKKLKYLSLTTHDETTKLWQKIEQTSQKQVAAIETLNKTLTSKTNALKEELSQTQEQFQGETQNLKIKIFEELEKSFSNLRETKVSRADLAEILFELCIRVKGTEFVPELKEAMEGRTDFLLPDPSEEGDEDDDRLNSAEII